MLENEIDFLSNTYLHFPVVRAYVIYGYYRA